MFDKKNDSLIMASFFNSLFREKQVTDLNNDSCLVFQFKTGSLLVEVDKYSLLGRHSYSGRMFINSTVGELVDFGQAARIVLESLREERGLDEACVDNFLERLLNNKENINLARAEWSKTEDFQQALYDYLATEQALIYGHSFHPTPKSKGFLEGEDQVNFSPEFAKAIKLKWYQVELPLIEHKSALTASHSKTIQDLAKWENEDIQEQLKPGFGLVVLHPIQETQLKKNPKFQSLLAAGRIEKIDKLGQDWFATSSLRTLYAPSAPFQLKFSLAVKLTNSMRYLSVSEANRGLQFYDAFHHDYLKDFAKRNPSFEIIFEPSYVGIKSTDEDVFKDSLVSFRENDWDSHTKGLGTVASLTQVVNDAGESMLTMAADKYALSSKLTSQSAYKRFFHGILDCFFMPVLDLAINFGVYGSAHAQNAILQFEDNFPKRCFFRDCQGTWYNPPVHEKLKNDIPALNDPNCLVIDKERSAPLFTYYIVINAGFNLITALAKTGVVSEKILVDQFVDRLEVVASHNPHPLFDYLLRKEKWSYKGNFMCTLDNLDEVSQSDPLRIYSDINNPLYRESRYNVDKVDPVNSENIYTFQQKQNSLDLKINDLETISLAFSHQGDTLFYETAELDKEAAEATAEFAFANFRSIENVTVGSLSFERSSFYQNASIFQYAKEKPLLSNKNDIRPTIPEGVVYRRQQPLTGNMLTLETLSVEKHLDIFHKWHNDPRVYDFWELNKSRQEIKEYIEKIKADNHAHPLILCYNNEPVGYFETYWCQEDRLAPYYDVKYHDRGMHLLIGSKKYLGLKNTVQAWQALQHFLFLDEPKTENVMLEPRADNANILKYAKVFKNISVEKQFDFPHKTAKLMRCTKKDFFESRYL